MNVEHAIEIANKMGSPSRLNAPWAAAIIALKDEVERLRAAQTPRPMSEAPRPMNAPPEVGVVVHVVQRAFWHGDGHWECEPFNGWLPLPVDQGEES